jgi:hypothetical protein
LTFAFLDEDDSLAYCELWAKKLERSGASNQFAPTGDLIPVDAAMEDRMKPEDWDIWMLPQRNGLLRKQSQVPEPKPAFLPFCIRDGIDFYQVFSVVLEEVDGLFFAQREAKPLNEPKSLGAVTASRIALMDGTEACAIPFAEQQEYQEHVASL